MGAVSMTDIAASQIVRNVTRMAGAYIGRKLISFVYFTLIARHTGVEITGFYFLLLSFAAVMTSLHDFGLSNTLIREGSRMPQRLQRYLNNVLGLKTLLSLGMIFSAVILLNVFEYAPMTKRLVMIVVAMMIFESLSDTFYGCLRVHHKMQFEARALVVGQLITLLTGGFALWLHPSLYLLVTALFLSQVYHMAYSAYRVIRELGLRPSLAFDKEILVPFVKISVPFLIAALFGQLLYADTFILKYLTTDRIVGLFSVPSSLVASLRFIPMAMEAAVFPAFSAFHVTSRDKLSRTFEVYFNSLLSIVAPIATLTTVAAKEIIDIIFGSEYLEAVPTLRVLSLAFIPLFLSQPGGRLLEACGKQVASTLLLGFSLVLNVILTMILTKAYGTIGIAFACLFGYSVLLVFTLYLVSSILKSAMASCLIDLVKVGLSGLIMGYALYLLKSHMPFLLAGAVSGALYLVCLVLLRGMTRQGFDRERAYGEWISLTRRVFQ